MLVYNVTIKIKESIEKEWIKWLKEIHVREMMATGCFTQATILKLMEIDDTEGPTYTIQYFVDSKAQYNLYIDKYAVTIRQKSFDQWGDKFIAFRSLMEVVN